jgi:hypothetical protein
MTRVPVHKGIGNHSAPVEILARSAYRRLEPSDPIWHNTDTTTTSQGRVQQPRRRPFSAFATRSDSRTHLRKTPRHSVEPARGRSARPTTDVDPPNVERPPEGLAPVGSRRPGDRSAP